jgi:hypothetical protein
MSQPTEDQFEAAERAVDDQFDPDQPLDLDQVLGDDEVDDALDTSWSPPERPLAVDEYGTTAAEQEEGETLDQRLAREVPDPNLAADLAPDAEDEDGVPVDDPLGDGEVGDRRAGRLVAPDQGLAEDREKDLVATDVGIDAGAAGAEEAAMHVVEDPEGNEPGDLDDLAAELAAEEDELEAGAAAAGVSPDDLADVDRDRPANR